MDYKTAKTLMKKYAKKAYGRKGEEIVEKNYAAMDIYTCREYPNNEVYFEIQEYLKKMFESSEETFTIIERQYDTSKDNYS